MLLLSSIAVLSFPQHGHHILPNHFKACERHHYHRTTTLLYLSSSRHPSRQSKTSLFISEQFGDLSGLTEDGDFAILGINAYEIEDKDDDNADETRRNSNTGTSIGWQGVGNMLFNEPLQQSGNVDIGVGPTNRYRNFRGNEVIPKEAVIDPRVRNWLVEVLPSLDENETECYAQGLSTLGFRPHCPTLCELQYDDLDFIEKVLHRRYLFKEITGISHPFEP